MYRVSRPVHQLPNCLESINYVKWLDHNAREQCLSRAKRGRVKKAYSTITFRDWNCCCIMLIGYLFDKLW